MSVHCNTVTIGIGREPTYVLEAEGAIVGRDNNPTDIFVTAIYRMSEGHILVDVERNIWGEWPSGRAPTDELEGHCQELLFEELKGHRAEALGYRRYRP